MSELWIELQRISVGADAKPIGPVLLNLDHIASVEPSRDNTRIHLWGLGTVLVQPSFDEVKELIARTISHAEYIDAADLDPERVAPR